MAKQKKKTGFKFVLASLVILTISILFWSSSILLFIGMLPTLVSWLIDKSFQKSKTLTIAAMNFVGCFPYLVDIWNAASPAEQSVRFLTDPLTIIMIYMMALFGYIINYITVMAVSSHLHEKAEKRIQKIEKEKSELEKRWGQKVNGETPLDEAGFPLDIQEIAEPEEVPS